MNRRKRRTRAQKRPCKRHRTMIPSRQYGKKHSAAATKIQRAFRDRKRKRPMNTRCAITLEPISDIACVFVKITESGFARGYHAQMLLNFFATRVILKWPVSRELVSSVELRRLESLLRVPPRESVHRRLFRIWNRVFFFTLQMSLESMQQKVIQDIERDQDNDNIVVSRGEGSRFTSFLASMLYLFVASKPKFRSIKNDLKRRGQSFVPVANLLETSSRGFAQHTLILGWIGQSVVPIIHNYRLPSNL